MIAMLGVLQYVVPELLQELVYILRRIPVVGGQELD
jgi:hypothetical protein